MIDCFDSLWHNTIISSDNENNEICYLCAASTHGGKGSVSRSVKENNISIFKFDMVSTDMLSDISRFGIHHI